MAYAATGDHATGDHATGDHATGDHEGRPYTTNRASDPVIPPVGATLVVARVARGRPCRPWSPVSDPWPPLHVSTKRNITPHDMGDHEGRPYTTNRASEPVIPPVGAPLVVARVARVARAARAARGHPCPIHGHPCT